MAHLKTWDVNDTNAGLVADKIRLLDQISALQRTNEKTAKDATRKISSLEIINKELVTCCESLCYELEKWAATDRDASLAMDKAWRAIHQARLT